MPLFENHDINGRQKKDATWILDNLDVFLSNKAKIGQITCYGDFNFGNIYRPEQTMLRVFLNSRDLDRLRSRCGITKRDLENKGPSLIKQKWFTKVSVYLFHLLDSPVKKQEAIIFTRLSEREQRSLQRELRKYQDSILPLVVRKKELSWKVKKEFSPTHLEIRRVVLEDENDKNLTSKTGLSDSQVLRYLTDLDLNHEVQRDAARCWHKQVTENDKNQQGEN